MRRRETDGSRPYKLGKIAQVVDGGEAAIQSTGPAEGETDALADLARLTGDIQTQDPGRAGGGQKQRREHLDGGGLAGAVRTKQTEQLATLDAERDVFYRNSGFGFSLPKTRFGGEGLID